MKRDPVLTNAFLLGIVALLLSLQALAVVVFVFSFFAVPSAKADFLPAIALQVRPERETLFYRVFVLTALGLQAAAVWRWRNRLADPAWGRALRALAVNDAVWVGLMGLGGYCLLTAGDPLPARYLVLAGFFGAVLSKVFWPSWTGLCRAAGSRAAALPASAWWERVPDGLAPLAIVLLVFMPDVPTALSEVYWADHFFHLDIFTGAVSWAFLKGQLPHVGVYTQYGTGMPMLLALLTQFFGGYTYPNLLQVMVLLAIGYYALLYLLLRRWLADAWLACWGVLLAIYFQVFSPMGFAFINWKHPNTSVVRTLWDVFVFLLLWRHLRSGRRGALWAAAALTGAAMFYILDTGVYLVAAFYAYLLTMWFFPRERPQLREGKAPVWRLAGLVVVPWLTAGALLLFVYRTTVFSAGFWGNMFEYIVITLKSYNALPFTFGLAKKGHVIGALRGMALPLFYVLSVAVGATWLWCGRGHRRTVPAVVWGVYGLCLYHYQVFRSAVYNYHAVMVPAVVLVCFWLRELWGDRTLGQRPRWLGLLFGGMAVALAVSPAFWRYPNLLHPPHPKLAEERAFFERDLDIRADADMIAGMTRSQDAVPVISSFENAFLMAANRKPFFYYVPAICSHFLSKDKFGGMCLVTKEQLTHMFRQLEEERPEVLFFEDKLFSGRMEPRYYRIFPELTMLIRYVREHYEPVGTGKYLRAFRRTR